MAGEPNIWALARRQTLLKSSRYRLNLKVAENKENFKKHPFRTPFRTLILGMKMQNDIAFYSI